MVKKCVLEGIIAGVLFALISWLGDKFIFDGEKSLLGPKGDCPWRTDAAA